VDVYVWDNGTITQVSDTPEQVEEALQWSADGRLVFKDFNGSRAWVWGGTQANELSTHQVYQYDWAPDGRLALMRDDVTVRGWDGTTMNRITRAQEMVWTSDGRLLLTIISGGRGDLFLWDGQSLTPLTDTPNTHESTPRLWP
jgi:WD40 repeat protein